MDTVKTYGPPGTGKTHTAGRWIERQVERGADKGRIAFVSFTNAACDEARRRIGARLELYDYELEYCATLHALAKRALRIEHRDWLADGKWLKTFADAHGYSLMSTRKSAGEDLDEFVKAGGEDALLLSGWDFGRSRLITDPEAAFAAFAAYDPESAFRIDHYRYLELVTNYEREKENSWPRRWDYTDLLLELLKHPVSIPVDVAVIDEAQDMTPLLWQVADTLFANTPARASLADDDQAIYSYQGADPALFNARPAEQVYQLQQSRRLPRRIAEHATRLINENSNRVVKHFQPVTEEIVRGRADRGEGPLTSVELEGEILRAEGIHQLDLLNGETWMVLVRNWAFVPAIVSQLETDGVPYQVQGDAHYSPWSGKGPLRAAQAIYALSSPGGEITAPDLAILLDKTRSETKEKPGAWKRGVKVRIREWVEANVTSRVGLLDLPHLGLTEWGFDRLVQRDLELLSGGISPRDLAAFQASQRRGSWGQEPRVLISTGHGVKGQEADNVAAVMACTNAPSRNLDRPDRREEEIRLAYVMATRARKRFIGVDGGSMPFGQPYEIFGV